jgi:hypothetical protein
VFLALASTGEVYSVLSLYHDEDEEEEEEENDDGGGGEENGDQEEEEVEEGKLGGGGDGGSRGRFFCYKEKQNLLSLRFPGCILSSFW